MATLLLGIHTESIIGSGQQLRDHPVPCPFNRPESWSPEEGAEIAEASLESVS